MKNSAANKLKQVPVGYLVIGIDPHQKKHASSDSSELRLFGLLVGRQPGRVHPISPVHWPHTTRTGESHGW